MAVIFFAVLPLPIVETLPFHYGLGLPRARHSVWLPRAESKNAILITIRQNSIHYRGDRILIKDLQPRIFEDLSQGAEHRAYLVIDSYASYGNVKNVINSINSAGIDHMSFLCDPRPF